MFDSKKWRVGRYCSLLSGLSLALSASADVNWNAVWTNVTSGAQTWSTATNWKDAYVGGSVASDNIDFSREFPVRGDAYYSTTDSYYLGQGLNLLGNPKNATFTSITGMYYQVIYRGGENSGSVTVVDPNSFRGIWAIGGLVNSVYNVNPESGKTAEFQQFMNGYRSNMKVAAGGKARIRDLLGDGMVAQSGAGELEIETPRSLTARVVTEGAGRLTIDAQDDSAAEPAPNAFWRFDASDETTFRKVTLDGDSKTYVTNWFDADGRNARAYAVQPPSTEKSYGMCGYPFVSANTVNGRHFLDFGAYLGASYAYESGHEETYGKAGVMYIAPTNSWNMYTLSKSLYEVFAVVRGHPKATCAGFLGSATAWHVMSKFDGDGLFDVRFGNMGMNARGGAGNYRLWMDGRPSRGEPSGQAWPGTDSGSLSKYDPLETHVVSVAGDKGSYPIVSAFGMQRAYWMELGGFQLGEVIAYTNRLTDAERRATTEYLKRKWLTGALAKSYDLDAVIVGNESTELNVEAGNVAKIRTFRQARNVQGGTANLVKTGEGMLEVDELLPRSATLEVKGGSVMLAHDTPVAPTSVDDVPTDGLLCWFDAENSTFTTSDAGIEKWHDRRADKAETVFVKPYYGSKEPAGYPWRPQRALDAASGLHVVDYGENVASNHASGVISIGGTTKSFVEWFAVWQRNGTGTPGLILDGSRGGGLRGDNDRLYSLTYCYNYTAGCLLTVNGEPRDTCSSTLKDFTDAGNGQLDVIGLANKNNNGASQPYLALSGWNNYQFNRGGCKYGEILCYNRRLTDAERRAVTAYLMNKWKNGAKLPLDAGDDVAKIAFASGVAPEVGTRTDRTVGAITGEGTLAKTGAGKLTVTSCDTAITNLDVAAGTLKTTVDWMGDAWLHLDASATESFSFKDGQSGEGAEILRWNDVRGNGLYAGTIQADTYSGYYCTNAIYRATTAAELGNLAEMPYVDFGSRGSTTDASVRGAGMLFYDASGTQLYPEDIAEFHLVFTFKSDNTAPLGSNNHAANGLTPTGNSYGGYWESTCINAATAAKRSNGSVWYSANSFTLPSGSCTDTFLVFSQVNTNGSVKAFSLGVDRDCGLGGVRLAEVLVFRGATNATATANAIHEYLLKKWKGIGAGAAVKTLHAVNVEAGATAELANLTGGAVALDALTGAGTLKTTALSGVNALDAVTVDGDLAPAEGFTLDVALDENGSGDPLTVTGAFTPPAAATVRVSVPDGFRALGEFPVITCGSLSATPDLSNWKLEVSGRARRAFALRATANGVSIVSLRRGILLLIK